MKRNKLKKLLIIAVFLSSFQLFSQRNYSVKLDLLKSIFGVYQIEGEYFKSEKLSYGFGYTYIDISLMLVGTPPESSEAEKGHSFSPFIRYYTKSNLENSSFYQANLRYSNMDFIGYAGNPKENILSIDFTYGYQFKIINNLFFEPSIGLGAGYVISGDENIKGDFKPYPMLNMNISLKI